MNRKIKRYLEEIERTEKKIEELQNYLKGVRVALKAEEENEMVKSIRSMKLNSHELFDLLNGIQDGTIMFRTELEIPSETCAPQGCARIPKGNLSAELTGIRRQDSQASLELKAEESDSEEGSGSFLHLEKEDTEDRKESDYGEMEIDD